MVERNGYCPYMTTGESLTITNDSVNAFVSLEEGLGINELKSQRKVLEKSNGKTKEKREEEFMT